MLKSFYKNFIYVKLKWFDIKRISVTSKLKVIWILGSVVSNTQRGYAFTLEMLEWFEKSKNKNERGGGIKTIFYDCKSLFFTWFSIVF